ncbi:MAG TPA: NfeD family protein [Actinomycetota bacterium]|nr:NfeD family protein [Actinomycetota bacterium]
MKVQGVIDQPLAAFVRSAIEKAKSSHAVVVLQLDSRGTYGDEALRLGRFIRASGVPVVTWIGPSGARASGGALFVAYGSGLVTMAPGAGLGPARPFDLATRASRESPNDVVRWSSELRGLAAGAGVAPQGIDHLVGGAQLAAGPAIRAGLATAAAPTVLDLFQKIRGKTVDTAVGTFKLTGPGLSDARFRDLGLWTRILHAVDTPTAVYVLLLIGLWGIAFEFTQPGVGRAGIGGALALALAGYGLSVVPVHWAGIALILAGTGAQALDVVIRRVAYLTGAGTAAFVVGSLWAWWGVASAIDVPLWLIILVSVGGFLLFGFGMTVALRARERVRSAQVGLVGLVGEARTDLNPEGGVFVKGTLWRARSMNGPIASGRRVRVRGIDGLILRVEEEDE